MHRAMPINGSELILRPVSARHAFLFRPLPLVSNKFSAFAHAHTQFKAQSRRRIVSTAAPLFSALKSVIPRPYCRPRYRSYTSATSSEYSPNIVYATIGICCAVFAYNGHATAELKERRNPKPMEFMNQNMICSTENWQAGRWWTFIMASFNHISLLHLGANMVTLYGLGPTFVSTFGARAYVLTWVVSSISSCGTYIWWTNHGRKLPFIQSVLQQKDTSLQLAKARYGGALGASAVIFGLSFGTMAAMPKAPVMIFPIPISFHLWAVNSFFAALSSYCLVTDSFPFIGHSGHLGGMAGGLVCGAMLLRR